MSLALETSPSVSSVPPFEPHPWVRGGHLQTIAGRYLPGPKSRLHAVAHEVEVAGGDRLLIHESAPDSGDPDAPTAVLVHGLGGCARSTYVARLAAKLVSKGVRAVRVNLRGAGAGFGLARGVYHGGRTEDLRQVVAWLADRAPGVPIALVGFSLGANLVLKLAAEAAARPLSGLDCVLAANPPLDLAACSAAIRRPENRIYDRNFVRLLRGEVARLHRTFPELGPVNLGPIRTVFDFDTLYTAPQNGFADASDYYRQSSAGPRLGEIAVPGLVVHAVDDPFIPVETVLRAAFPPGLALELIPGGGHLGYFSRTPWDGDRRWLDARLASWLASRWALGPPAPAGVPVRRTIPEHRRASRSRHA